MTTLRKLPMARPTTSAARLNAYASIVMEIMELYVTKKAALRQPCLSDSALNDLSELEDRQIHGDDHAADERTQHHHDDRFQQAGDRSHRVVHYGFEEVGDLA